MLAALTAIKPDIILVEGPPEGETLLEWAAHAEMQPPVALLAYATEEPQNAVFYPFTDFSPEWQAIRFGLQHKIPVRLMDMPLVHQLLPSAHAAEDDPEAAAPEAAEQAQMADYPLQELAKAAGFENADEWWEQYFERLDQPTEVFEAISLAMTALRERYPASSLREQRREAFMRRALRKARQEMYSTICVVCGAWHAPALESPDQYLKADEALLKNLYPPLMLHIHHG